ncbi:MAG: hypothetical protein Q7K57_59035 [Burkholderiaceae bacterium]|nr:hypothetical protein [Polaromonas sp.]MDO8778457.1 hypothetical protein [Burkholderiaceae bacterium]
MSDDAIFCTKIPIAFIENCMTMSEWGSTWQALGIVVTLITMIGAGWKVWTELTTLRIQRANDSLLKRTEFFLTQHRLLFDDPVLFEILQYIDGDGSELTEMPMWDKKRKFLTFIEEISFLSSANLINPSVAYYMFGYYAISAKNGENFMVGIDLNPIHWQAFFEFCEKAELFFAKNSGSQRFELKL